MTKKNRKQFLVALGHTTNHGHVAYYGAPGKIPNLLFAGQEALGETSYFTRGTGPQVFMLEYPQKQFSRLRRGCKSPAVVEPFPGRIYFQYLFHADERCLANVN